jgi:hypothetical protein
MAMNESVSLFLLQLTNIKLGKKITFYEILQRMIEAGDCEVSKWRQDPSEKCSPGDACCAGGDLSPE